MKSVVRGNQCGVLLAILERIAFGVRSLRFLATTTNSSVVVSASTSSSAMARMMGHNYDYDHDHPVQNGQLLVASALGQPRGAGTSVVQSRTFSSLAEQPRGVNTILDNQRQVTGGQSYTVYPPLAFHHHHQTPRLSRSHHLHSTTATTSTTMMTPKSSACKVPQPHFRRSLSTYAATTSIPQTVGGWTMKENYDTVGRQRLSLRRHCRELGLKMGGTKETLIRRIQDFYQMQNRNEERVRKSRKVQQQQDDVSRGRNRKLNLNPDQPYIVRVKGISKADHGAGVGIVVTEQEQYNGEDAPQHWHEANWYLPDDHTMFEVEYEAILAGLEYARSLGVQHAILQTDHNIISKQLQGKIPAARDNIKHLYGRVQSMVETGAGGIERLDVEWIKSSANEPSKELALLALTNKAPQSKAMLTGNTIETESRARNGRTSPATVATRAKATTSRRMVQPSAPVASKERTAVIEAARPEKSKEPSSEKTNGNGINPKNVYLVQFDGGARLNPSKIAGCGMVIYDRTKNGKEVWCGYRFMGNDDNSPKQKGGAVTNNQAEYSAFVGVLEQALEMGIQRVVAEGDSELLVRQIKGEYQVKNPVLRQYHGRAMKLIAQFDDFVIRHIPRKENSRADFLANHAMDLQSSSL